MSRNRGGQLWCMYTVQGAADEDEASPNAFPVVQCASESPTLGELAASFAVSRPVQGERWHWRVKVSDEAFGWTWEDLTAEDRTVRSEEIGANVFAVFAKIVDVSPRAVAARVARGTTKTRSGGVNGGVSKPKSAAPPAPEPAYVVDEPAAPPTEELNIFADDAPSSHQRENELFAEAPKPTRLQPPPPPATHKSEPSLLGGDDDRPVVEDDDDPPLESPRTTTRHSSSTPDLMLGVEEDVQQKKTLEESISENQATAKEEIRRRNAEAAEHEKEMDRLRVVLGPKLKNWSEEFGKKKNIRALLAGMDKVMWPEANWKPISIGDLLQPAQVKKAYYKASRCCHPDKLVGLSLEQRFIGQTIFDALSQALVDFEEQNGR